jgi:hypothetical protein
MCFGPTNALVCNKTLIQMSHIKTLKITPACFDHQLIITRELFILVKITPTCFDHQLIIIRELFEPS